MTPSKAVASVVVTVVVTFASPPIISYVFIVTLLKGLPNTSSPIVRFDAKTSSASFVPSPSVSTNER